MLPIIAALLSGISTGAGVPAMASLAGGTAASTGIWGQVAGALGTQMGSSMITGAKAPPLQQGSIPTLPAGGVQQATPRYLQETQKKQPAIQEMLMKLAGGGM